MKYAILDINNYVTNIALADAPLAENWIEAENVGIGWQFVDGQFIEPTQPIPSKLWAAFDFYRRFTSPERIAIRTLAKTDPIAEDFLHTLDAAIASKSNVLAEDSDTVAGLSYLVSQSVLTQQRMDEILS